MSVLDDIKLDNILLRGFIQKNPWGSLCLGRVEYLYYSTMPGREGELVARVSLLESPMEFEEVYISQPILSNYVMVASMLTKGCGVVLGWLSNARPIIIACIPISYKRSTEIQEQQTPDTKYGFKQFENTDLFKQGEWKQGELILQSAVVEASEAKKLQPGPRLLFDRYGSIRLYQEWEISGDNITGYKAGDFNQSSDASTRKAYVEARIGLGYLTEADFPNNPIKDGKFSEPVRLEVTLYDTSRNPLYRQQVTNTGSVNIYIAKKVFADIKDNVELKLGKQLTLQVTEDVALTLSKAFTLTVSDNIDLSSAKKINASASQEVVLEAPCIKCGSGAIDMALKAPSPPLCVITGAPIPTIFMATKTKVQ